MGHPHLRSGGAVSGQTAAQQRYPFRYIATFKLGPPAIDCSLRTPHGETLFGRHLNQLTCPLIQACVTANHCKQPGADRQAHG